MDFTSKLSLYDILTQLISGFLILALFIPMPESSQENVTESYQWIFLLIFSYLTGIIYHRLLEWIRSKKRKWFEKYSRCYKKCKKDIYTCICKLWYVIKDCIFTIFRRNYIGAIIKANKKVYNVDENGSIKLNKDEINVVIEMYYKIYYSIMDKPAYNTIMFLEAQEAFLRNITLIVVAYHLCYYCSWIEGALYECIFILEPPSMLSSNCLILWVSLVSFLILILIARYHTQMKVYEAVWGAGKYYKY